jgi:glycosyltransferase involved in cell wall biosynthesis
LFPIRSEPHRGQPIYRTVLELQRWASVEVVYTTARYLEWKWLRPASYIYRAADLDYSPDGVKVHYAIYAAYPLLSRPFNAVFCSRAVLPVLRAIHPDVVLAYWIHPEGSGALSAGRRLGVPVVVGSRGTDLNRPPDPLSYRLMRQTLRNADFVITVSPQLTRRAIELGVRPEHVQTILNGCDSSIFRPRSLREARATLGIPPEAQLILYVGHLVAHKGVSELAEAFLRLAGSHPRLMLSCVGEGSLRPELERRFTEAGLDRRTLFPGALPALEVARWMNAADLLCLPSHAEGCPNVVLEALASGRPVVATNVGAIPDLVDSESGILIPCCQPEALATALESAFERSWDEQALAARCSRSWQQVAEETFRVCERLARRS